MPDNRDSVTDVLRDAIFAAYRELETTKKHAAQYEYAYRQQALQSIDEILEHRPLIQFSATHLNLLEFLFAYWRELEVERQPPAPEPIGPEGLMSVWQGALPPPNSKIGP